MENIPELPHGLKPLFVFYEDYEKAQRLVILAEDERCVYKFYWDGESVTYDTLRVGMKYGTIEL